MPISLLIADDHPVVRQGLLAVLEGSEINLIGEASSGNEAIEQAMRLKPDTVLLDVRMPDTDGLEALERINDRSPRTKVVMFTAHENPTYVARAVALGAAPLRQLASFLVLVVEAASRTIPASNLATGIRCRANQCRGTIFAAISSPADDIAWRCSRCNHHGLIHHWQGTKWDATVGSEA